MDTTAQLPTITQLHELIASVKNYPVKSHELVELAAKKRAPRSVVRFYKDFPANQTFDDADDLAARSEQIQIMESDLPEQPWEQLGPQE